MPKVSRVALAGSAGAQTPLTCNIPCRRVEILEDGNATAQGYTFTYPDGTVRSVPASISQTTPLVLGDTIAHGNGKGSILGFPAQGYPMNSAATVYGNARSLTATANTLVMTEIE